MSDPTVNIRQQYGHSDNNSSIIDKFLRSAESGKGGVLGILCNDSSGLCIESKGLPVDGSADVSSNDKNSGVYTSIARLAYQLEGNSVDPETSATSMSSPLITIETEPFNILVKEYYEGNTIAMRVPSRSDTRTRSQKNGGSMDKAVPLHPDEINVKIQH